MASRGNTTYSVTIKTLGGSTFTAADGEGSKAGYVARQSFLHGEIIEIPGEGTTTYVPYHAIDNIVITETKGTEEYTDDTCKTE